MVVELLTRPGTAAPARREQQPINNLRSTTSPIHPPNKRITRRVEPTSALQLARDLAELEIEHHDATALRKLADLTALQLHQGPVADRLQLFFSLSRILSNNLDRNEAIRDIVSSMLTHVRSLFTAVAPNLRWTALASLATIIERPCFSRTARKLATAYLCAFIPQALEDSLPRDKAAVYSILHDLTQRGYVKISNSNRILAGATQHLCLAMRDASLGLRRQMLEQHIALLERRTLKSIYAIVLVQSTVKEFAYSVAESMSAVERDFFERSLRRALQ